MTDIAARVVGIIEDFWKAEGFGYLPKDGIVPGHHLEDYLGFDSIDVTEIIMMCEEQFRITISDSEAEALDTVNSLIETVLRKTRT